MSGGVAAVLLATVVACAPAAPATSGAKPGGKPTTALELATYTGADRQQILEAGAKAEGALTWYTSLAGDIVDRLAEGFKAKYPFIAVDIFRGAENEILTRATQEAQAGKQVFDVVESPFTTAQLLNEAKLITPYISPSLKNIPAEFKSGVNGDQVQSATVRLSFISFGYNTTLIPESAVPKTHADLMNPALAGKMALAGSTTGKRWVGTILNSMGEDKGTAFIEQLSAQQKPTVQQVSGKALLDLIAKGEVAASPTIFRDHVDIMLMGNKAPVKWVALEPVTANVGQGVYAAKAPHPNAGMLFIDYLFGEGQQVLEKNGYTTASEKLPFKTWIPEQGKTADQIEKDAKAWDALFAKAFRR